MLKVQRSLVHFRETVYERYVDIALQSLSFAFSVLCYLASFFLQQAYGFYHPAGLDLCPRANLTIAGSLVQMLVWAKLAHVATFWHLKGLFRSKQKYMAPFFCLVLISATVLFDLLLYSWWASYFDYLFVLFFLALFLLLILAQSLVNRSSLRQVCTNFAAGALVILVNSSVYALTTLLNPLLFKSLQRGFGFNGTLVYTYLFPFICFGLEGIIRLGLRLTPARGHRFVLQSYWLLLGF
jgi:hypothetical protein